MTNFNPNRFRPDPKPTPKKKEKLRIKRSPIKKKKELGFIGMLDSELSKYIRQKYADEFGRVKCYTCPTKMYWKEMQNGHYITRANMATRFDENNCRPQCATCNQFKEGRVVVFGQLLFKEIGPKAFLDLLKKKREVVQFRPHTINDLIEKYKHLNKQFNG